MFSTQVFATLSAMKVLRIGGLICLIRMPESSGLAQNGTFSSLLSDISESVVLDMDLLLVSSKKLQGPV